MFRKCAKILLDPKSELLLADKEYEIHFLDAGSKFDSSAMIATSFNGRMVEGVPQSIVQFCVYPALIQHDSNAGASANLKDFSAVLLYNKSFYPTNSPRYRAEIVAKATVLLA